MKFLKSLLMGTGGVVLAGIVLALLAPKAVHAVVATAVQVVNTSANPAITEDASLQASQIVTISCQITPDISDPFCRQILPNGLLGAASGPNGGYVVPANQYFVLKSMDTSIFNGSVPLIRFLLENDTTNGATYIENVQPAQYGQISFSSGLAVGPGIELLPSFQPNTTTEGFIVLHGYLTSN